MNLRPALWLVLACTSACSATVLREPGDGSSGPDDGGTPDGAIVNGGDTGVDIPYFDTRAYDVYTGNPCPDAAPPPMRVYNCDPFATAACPPGQSCYPYIQYPSTNCGVETYRTDCMPEGSAGQDQFCTTGTDCLSGYSCFVTGAMNRCLQLCRVDGTPPQCTGGAVCEPTDIPDYGACQ